MSTEAIPSGATAAGGTASVVTGPTPTTPAHRATTRVATTSGHGVRPRGADDERTLGQLVSDASKDLSSILRSEVQLAKAEVTAEAKTAGQGAAMFVVAGLFGFFALMMLLFALAYGLVALGLSPWLSFLLVAVLLLVVAGLLALIGKSRLSKIGKPERTVRTAKETVDTLKGVKPHTA